MSEVQPRRQDLASFRLPEGFRGRSAIVVQIWWIVSALLFRPSPQVLYGWRRFLLRLFGARIGRGVILRPSVRVTYPWKLTIDDNAWVGDRVELYTLGEIHIGHDAVVSQGTYLCTGTHDPRDPSFPISAHPIVVEPEAWIAAEAFVLPGRRIGRAAVVAARAVVTTDVPEEAVVAGHPARIVSTRMREDRSRPN